MGKDFTVIVVPNWVVYTAIVMFAISSALNIIHIRALRNKGRRSKAPT